MLTPAAGRARGADAGEGAARHLEAAALPDAGAGRAHRRGRGRRGLRRPGARHGRGDEDGERAARRAQGDGSPRSTRRPATAWRSTTSSWSSSDARGRHRPRASRSPARRDGMRSIRLIDLAHRGRRRAALRDRAVEVDQHQRRSRAGRSCWRSGPLRRGIGVGQDDDTARPRAPPAAPRACAICWMKRGSSGVSAKTTSGRAIQSSSSSVGWSRRVVGASARPRLASARLACAAASAASAGDSDDRRGMVPPRD